MNRRSFVRSLIAIPAAIAAVVYAPFRRRGLQKIGTLADGRYTVYKDEAGGQKMGFTGDGRLAPKEDWPELKLATTRREQVRMVVTKCIQETLFEPLWALKRNVIVRLMDLLGPSRFIVLGEELDYPGMGKLTVVFYDEDEKQVRLEALVTVDPVSFDVLS